MRPPVPRSSDRAWAEWVVGAQQQHEQEVLDGPSAPDDWWGPFHVWVCEQRLSMRVMQRLMNEKRENEQMWKEDNYQILPWDSLTPSEKRLRINAAMKGQTFIHTYL